MRNYILSLATIGILLFYGVESWTKGEDRVVATQDFKTGLKSLFRVDASAYEKKLSDRAKSGAKEFGLTSDEKVAVYGYTVGLSRELNAALRAGGTEAEKYRLVSDTLTSALKKLPAYVGIVARATVLPASVMKKYVEGAVVSDPAFLSTTAGELTDNRRDYMNIVSRTGRKIAYYSAFPTEGEVLFLPGTTFKVLKVTPRKDEGTVVDLEEVVSH